MMMTWLANSFKTQSWCALFGLALLSFELTAEEFLGMGAIGEQHNESRVSGVAFMGDVCDDWFYPCRVGVSFNRIDAGFPVEVDNREVVYPVFTFFNFQANYIVSPFFEVGIDIGDAFVSQALDWSEYPVNSYVSLGVALKPSKEIELSAYVKRYNLDFYEYDEDLDVGRINERFLNVAGASVFVYF